MFMLMLEFSKRTQDSSVVSLIQPSEMLWPLQALQRETDHCQYPLAHTRHQAFYLPWKAGFIPIGQCSTTEHNILPNPRVHALYPRTTGLQQARKSSRVSLKTSPSNCHGTLSTILTCMQRRTDLWYWRAAASTTTSAPFDWHIDPISQTLEVLHKLLCTDGLCTIRLNPTLLQIQHCTRLFVPHPPECTPGVICDGSFALPDISLTLA